MTNSVPTSHLEETVAGVTARIREWVALAVPGIVWIRYVSDDSRDLVLERLSAEMAVQRIGFHPPDPGESAGWLEEQLVGIPSVAAILFSPLLSADKEALPAAFRSLNLRREAIARLPVIQLWWIPASAAGRAESEAPDLASWFQIRMKLGEIVASTETPRSREALQTSRSDFSAESVEAIEAAVGRQRELAASDAASYSPQLAAALVRLASAYRETQRFEDAETSYGESLSIYRRLAELNSEAYLPGLVGTLNDLAITLKDLGRYEEALARVEESVRTYRRLAQQRPEAFLPDLAMSLNNWANILSELGHREEALTRADESLQIRRRLAQQSPDAFLPDLAMSLSNYANRLSDLGRREEALTQAEESVRIRRRLAQQRPGAFLPDLAMSLNNYAIILSDLGRREEALTQAEEAVRIFQQLAQQRPDAFLPALALSLDNWANRLSDVGRREEALAQAEEAVRIRRQLAQQRPDAFLPALALSLDNWANRLSDVGRHEEALAQAEEAIRIYRQLAQQHPDVFLPNLAHSLAVRGQLLSKDRPTDAMESLGEAIRILTPFFVCRPEAHAALAKFLRDEYLRTVKSARIAPDETLLAPMIESPSSAKF